MQRALVKLSELVQDVPEVVALDINPLLVDEHGAVALDARVVLHAAPPGPAAARLAILPYPRDLEETIVHATLGTLTLRPVKPEDEASHFAFLSSGTTPTDLRFRFGGTAAPFTHAQVRYAGRAGPPVALTLPPLGAARITDQQLAEFTQIDYDKEMTFVAVQGGATLGAVRLVRDAVYDAAAPATAEFAVLVAHDAQHSGLAHLLLDKAVAYARAQGLAALHGSVLRGNVGMRRFCAAYGFAERTPEDPADDNVYVTLRL